MRISDWSSDVCSSDLSAPGLERERLDQNLPACPSIVGDEPLRSQRGRARERLPCARPDPGRRATSSIRAQRLADAEAMGQDRCPRRAGRRQAPPVGRRAVVHDGGGRGARRRSAALEGQAQPAHRVEPRRRRSCRSEEHTSELQSLMRISYAVFCLKKNNPTKNTRSAQQKYDGPRSAEYRYIAKSITRKC